MSRDADPSLAPEMPALSLPMIGVDLVEVARVRRLVEELGVVDRLFTPLEQEYCRRFAEPWTHWAARFAAKEAAAKALGCGIGAQAGWTDIETVRGGDGPPHLRLHGAAAERATRLGVGRFALSLSHTSTHAIAFVVLSA